MTGKQVLSVLPITYSVTITEVCWRVWERYGLQWLYDEPREMQGVVARHLRRLVKGGAVAKDYEGKLRRVGVAVRVGEGGPQGWQDP
jgi:hypothetical protein